MQLDSSYLSSKSTIISRSQTADRTSDMFSLVGTVFLWMMWPSFNACTAVPGQAQHRAILNSYFSLCSCVVTTLVASAALNRKHNWKFELEHVQNATLAGGVVIGVCADLIVEPYGALIVGGIAGVVSTLGFKYVTVRLFDLLQRGADSSYLSQCALYELAAIFGDEAEDSRYLRSAQLARIAVMDWSFHELRRGSNGNL